MTRPFAAIHDLNGSCRETGPFAQSQQSLPQRTFRQGRESIEQRQNQKGGQHDYQQLKTEHAHPRPQPPAVAHPLDQAQNERQERITEHQRDQQSFEPVHPPCRRRRGVEAKAFLESELRIPIERQTGQRKNHSDDEQEPRLRPSRRTKSVREQFVATRQNAAEQNGEEHGGVPSVFPGSEAALGQCVLDGLGVCGVVD